MKKILSVIILLAFVGTTIVMTGCLGGDDGVAAALGTAFVIAIVASSGGSAATAAFAANQRPALRPAIASTSTNISMRVLALDDAGTTQKTYEIKNNQLTWNDNANGVDSIESSFTPNDSYNQYRVQVFYDGNVILEGMDFYKNSEKGPNQKETINVTATSTAKVLIYDKWNTGGTERNYDAFEKALKDENIDYSTLAASIETDLANGDYDNSDLTVPAAPAPATMTFTVSGTVNGLSMNQNASIYAYDSDTKERISGVSDYVFVSDSESNINYEFQLPNGTYDICPKDFHNDNSYATRTITINNDDVVNVNFQAQTFAASNR
jgi:hypothetical protein